MQLNKYKNILKDFCYLFSCDERILSTSLNLGHQLVLG